MMKRRAFLSTTAATLSTAAFTIGRAASTDDRPALLGGEPIRTEPFPAWPRMDQREDRSLLEVLHSGRWFRGGGTKVSEFEEAFAQKTGARHCLATANGTSALIVSLAALEIGPGDEVIVPPYTFVATVNAVLMHHAVPIFVDTDRETFQINASKIENALSDRTAAIIPVHLGGNVANLDQILEIGRARNIPIVEDACQAHLAEWNHQKVGTIGSTGCFSFQVSKNLSSGEGGAILTNDDELMERCYAVHNNGRTRRTPGYDPSSFGGRSANLRLTEFQGALLLAQMTRLEEQSRTREQNASYLTSLLDDIPGIHPAQMYSDCTRNAYHLYMWRYDPSEFSHLSRDRFLQALTAEGIPGSSGYNPLNQESFLPKTLNSKGFQRIYSKAYLDDWSERNACPENDKLCAEAVWLTQNMLLGPRSDMDQIADAIRKIQKHAPALAKD